MRLRNRARLQLEELERRETPSAPFIPDGPPSEPAGQTDQHPAPIPMVTGTFTAFVTVSDMNQPIVATFTINHQTGAHFETTITAGGVTVDLKGELNQAQGTVHFDCTILANGQKVGTASGEGTFVDPTCGGSGCTRGQIDSFNATFTFTMADGTTGSGTAAIEMGTPPT